MHYASKILLSCFLFVPFSVFSAIPNADIELYHDSPEVFNGSSDFDTFLANSYSTISFWFTPAATITSTQNGMGIFSYGTLSYGIRLGSVTANATDEIVTIVDGGNSSIFFSNSALTFDSGVEYFMTLVWESGTYRLYVNDVDYGLASVVGSPSKITFTDVGRFRNDSYFSGSMRDLRLYNSSLTSLEVLEIYNGPQEDTPDVTSTGTILNVDFSSLDLTPLQNSGLSEEIFTKEELFQFYQLQFTFMLLFALIIIGNKFTPGKKKKFKFSSLIK